MLIRHDFPGNIRELENIIEHGFVLCRGSIIQKEHLPPELLQIDKDIDFDNKSTPITESLDEQTQIITALKNCERNISQAANEMGIHRTTLWRKIKRYNIDINEI